MLYTNQTGVGQFISAFGQGFVQTRLDILFVFLITIALLLFFLIYFVAQRSKARRIIAAHSREMLEHLIAKLDLNAQETALLGRLSLYIDRGESLHALLINHHVFDACARKMGQHEQYSETHLDALRLKIGFRLTQPEEVPGSSSELAEGSSVLLVAGSKARFGGTILAQGPTTMLVKLDSGTPFLTKDLKLTAYFHNAAGIFSFSTKISEIEKDAVRIEHSSQIMRHQRRNYYRRREFLPVYIMPFSVGAVPLKTHLIDLGGGGASFQNPKGRFEEGDLLEMSFSLQMTKLTMLARVLRYSRMGRVMRVKFESLSDKDRDSIMRFLFAQSERKQAPSDKPRTQSTP